MILLTMLAAVTIAIVRQRSLFGVVILFGIYSFLMASVLVVLDAIDVAMIEASVGAGLATVILLATLHLIKTTEVKRPRYKVLPLVVAIATGAILTLGVMSLPPFGRADNPIHHHVAPLYLDNSLRQSNVPNVVASVLADYRGYDTLGEVTVIFTAGIGVILLLRGGRRRGRHDTGGHAHGPRDRQEDHR